MTKMLAKSTYSIANFQSQCDKAWLLVDVYILFSFLYRWVGLAFSYAWTSSSQESNSKLSYSLPPMSWLMGRRVGKGGEEESLSISIPHLQKVIEAHTCRADFGCMLGSEWSSPSHSTSPMSHSVLFTASPLHSWCAPHFKLNPHLACEQALHFEGITRRQASAARERRFKCEGTIPSFLLSLAFSCSLFHLHSKWRTYLPTNPHSILPVLTSLYS